VRVPQLGRQSRVRISVGAASLSVVLAASAAAQGGFLARDVEVGSSKPLFDEDTPLRLPVRYTDAGWLPDVGWLGRPIELVLQALLGALALAVVIAVGYSVVLGLLRIRALLLSRSTAGQTPAGYDPGELTREDTETALRERMREVVAVGAEALDGTGDAAEGVVACYAAMESAAARAGTGRQAFDTPHELLRRLLAEQPVSPHTVGELTGLYEQVRYGAQRPDEAMRERARRCLAAIRAELGEAP
jgi:hypothetical protein